MKMVPTMNGGVRGRRKRPHLSSTSTPAPTVIASIDGQGRRAWRLSNRGTDAGVLSRGSARQHVACAIAGRLTVHCFEREMYRYFPFQEKIV